MVGKHGIGKSQVVEQWAKENGAHLEILFLAQQEISDLIGMPRTTECDGEVITIWTTPIWLQRLHQASALGKDTILFLDELSRSPLDVRQGALQLVLERRIHQHILPTTGKRRTLIIAADNPDGDVYQSDSLDPALLDRFLSVTVEPDVEGWLKYAREMGVSQVIRDFITENPSRLHFMPEEGGLETVSATPRSWVKLSHHLINFDKIPVEAHYAIIKGKVGSAVGSQFYQFMCSYNKQVKMEDVEKIANKAWGKTKNIEETSVFVAELIQGMESVQKQEMTQNFLHKYVIEEKIEDYTKVIPLLGMLYALEIEDFMSVFKPLTTATEESERAKFKAIIDFDKDCNNKALLRRSLNVQKEQKVA